MSEESRENDFWNNFDDTFNFGASKNMGDAVENVKTFSFKYVIGSLNSDSLGQILNRDTEEVKNVKENIKYIANVYMKHFTDYLENNLLRKKDFDEDSKLFHLISDFGQGILYDPRNRPNTRHMHVMDGYLLYYLWHRFNWMANLLHIGFGSPFNVDNWLYLDRLVGTAAEIHSIAQPDQSCVDGSPPPDPENGDVLSIGQIKSIGSNWKDLSFDEIEKRLATLKRYEAVNRCEKKPRPDIPDIL